MSPASPNPNASCSEDERLAQLLSRTLRAPAPAAPSRPTEGYTRLSLGTAPVPPSPPAPVAAPSGVPTRVGAEGWNRMLQDTVAYAGARGGFIVDASGLPVALLAVPGELDVERLGSRLALAFDQVDRMADQPCRHFSLSLGPWTLTGIRLAPMEEGPLMVGLLSEGPLPLDRLDRLASS